MEITREVEFVVGLLLWPIAVFPILDDDSWVLHFLCVVNKLTAHI